MFTRAARIKTGLVLPSISVRTRLIIPTRFAQRSFANQSASSTMATGSRVHLEASQQPQFYVKGLTAESAEKTSQLLQVNHEKHHIFFNRSGFHVSQAVSNLTIIKRLTHLNRTILRITFLLSSPSMPRLPKFKKVMMSMCRINDHPNR
jgi:hypothetical protein